MPRTIRANLQHYEVVHAAIVPERLVGFMRQQRRLVDLDEVVLLVDQSGSMCISDPPGSQGVAGLCEQFATAVGIQTPARVRALQALTQQFATQPNVTVTIVPVAQEVNQAVANLQAQLGKGTDMQGALSSAYGVIASDIADLNTNTPQLLPRTRYVVVFLTDGTPYPRCSANDDLSQYADPTHPELIWADSLPDYCNLVSGQGSDAINGFIQ